MSLLQIEGLTVGYGGVVALHDFSLAVAPGEIVALVGESGSGKSTAALAAMDLLPASADRQGNILFNGQKLSDLPPREQDRLRGRHIAMIFQEPGTALNPRMRIGTQVREALRTHDTVSRRDLPRRTDELLERVGLPAAIISPRRFPHQLSGGQRQRVAIAMAISAGPALLVADEPTTALDVTTQAHVLALLRRLVEEDGMALLLVSHDLAVVAGIADHIVVMKDGAAVEAGTPSEILTNSKADYTRTLVAKSGHTPVRAAIHESQPLLAVHDLTRVYRAEGHDKTAVDRASFEVRKGETVGLVGESGSGKTTLLRAVLGLDVPQGGQVLIGGVDVTAARGPALRNVRRAMQAVFQDPGGSLDPRFRIEQVVAEPLHLLDQPVDRRERRQRRQRVEKALIEVGLQPSDADRYPHQFSGGQRQRIAIARALVIEPALVVLDEAVSALDVSVRAGILDLLARLSDRLGIAYLFVSHDIALMQRIADRLIVLKDGKIVEQGSTRQLIAAPAHPYTAALLAATPDINRALAARSSQA